MILQGHDGKCLGPSRTLALLEGRSRPFLIHIRLHNPKHSGLDHNSRSKFSGQKAVSALPGQAELSTQNGVSSSQQDEPGACQGVNGDGKVVTTFRWPAALAPLDGKEVSVVGEPLFELLFTRGARGTRFPIKSFAVHYAPRE